ncbi:hypothetical protein HU200_038838 [Digitaria exilis]|uniref:Uncharacterized protein n=1 Tax=Digitaria exilis TaxID=1010633 RepID=A0A835BCX0_9POAL|nr:hypothetical protein HU200_038838 [Digitaria exilis]
MASWALFSPSFSSCRSDVAAPSVDAVPVVTGHPKPPPCHPGDDLTASHRHPSPSDTTRDIAPTLSCRGNAGGASFALVNGGGSFCLTWGLDELLAISKPAQDAAVSSSATLFPISISRNHKQDGQGLWDGMLESIACSSLHEELNLWRLAPTVFRINNDALHVFLLRPLVVSEFAKQSIRPTSARLFPPGWPPVQERTRMRPENPKKEPVDVLREESSAAAAAQSRRPPLRPRSASKYGPMGNRKTEAESPPPPPPPQLRCLLPALRPPSASKNGPMGNRKREAESPPLPPPPQLRSLLPPLHPPSASKNGPIGQPEAGGRNPSAVAAAVEAASAAQRKGRGIVGGKSFLPPRAASASRAREPSSVGGEPPLPRRPRAPKGKKPMSAAEVVESGVIVRDKWEEMKENCIDVKETFDNQLLEREDQEDGGERYSGERPGVWFLAFFDCVLE